MQNDLFGKGPIVSAVTRLGDLYKTGMPWSYRQATEMPEFRDACLMSAWAKITEQTGIRTPLRIRVYQRFSFLPRKARRAACRVAIRLS